LAPSCTVGRRQNAGIGREPFPRVADIDIRHALRNVLRAIVQDYDGEMRLFVIGADRDGRHLREIGRALTALEQAETGLHSAVEAVRAAGDLGEAIGLVLGTSRHFTTADYRRCRGRGRDEVVDVPRLQLDGADDVVSARSPSAASRSASGPGSTQRRSVPAR
jgi:hypothetical protein